MSYFTQFSLADSASIDAFGRLRVSNPVGLFDSQFVYTLAPLLFEQITNGSGAAIALDATNRSAVMTFASTPTGGKAYMQSYEYFRYQPGKSQLARLTFNLESQVANVLKFVGYSDGVNGIEFQNNGSQNQIVIYSGTGVGNQTIAQSSWNIDKFDGTGPSATTLDITKANHLVIDLQALYVGRVRVGFDIAGKIFYAHEFLLSNTQTYKYIQSASLPVRCGMTCTGTVSTTMQFICSSVASEGGSENAIGYEFDCKNTANVTAASGTRTHLLSLRPKTTFNSITNRTKIGMLEVDIIAIGNNPIVWELCIGQVLTGASYSDINTTYSSSEFTTAGTLSGSPAIVLDSGFVAATNNAKSTSNIHITAKYPITLDAAGAVRALGTITLLASGIGGASDCRGSIKFVEIR